MRVIFVATGEIALPAFRYLLENGPKPLALVTQPDKPVGRKQVLTPPAIKTVAIESGVPVLQPEVIGDIADELMAMDPEVVIVFAYGQILRQNVLELGSRAIINLHASLLPKYRGAACIQAAIDAGDQVTGMTAQHVVKKLDAGDLILAKELTIADDDTGGTLHDRLAELAVPTLVETLEVLADGTANRVQQDEATACYIGKLGREHGKLDWSMTAVEIERRIRAYDPWPGTFTTVVEDSRAKRLKIFPPTMVDEQALTPGEVVVAGNRLWVGTGEGRIELKRVQPDGGKRMSVEDYLRGRIPGRMD